MKEESLLLLSDLQKLINQVVLIDYTIIILGGEKVNIPSETIVKFKNGTELHMPSGIYEKISFDKDSIMELKWEENGIDYKVQFFFDDVLYIAETTQSTSKG